MKNFKNIAVCSFFAVIASVSLSYAGETSFPLLPGEYWWGGHSSEPFNPNLAQVFFKSGLIEAGGSGFDKIRAGCEEYGGELPAYEISENGIMVLCKACPSYLEMLENEVDKVHGSEGKSVGKCEGKCEGKRRLKSNSRILGILEDNPNMTREEIAAELNLSVSRIEKVIRQLRNEGKLIREGSARNGRWKVL
jgi:ATP-dependent DNA helicase RecG